MPPLSNPRHERFVQALFEGETADAAYEKAGYRRHDGNCIRLRGNERVKARLLELQTQAAKASEVTVVSLLAELEDARKRADSLEQLSAATTAIMGKAKLAGLLRDKVEIGAAGDFDSCDSVESVAERLLDGWGGPTEQFRPVTDEDRHELAALLRRQWQETEEFLTAIRARPVLAVRVDHPSEIARRRTSPTR